MYKVLLFFVLFSIQKGALAFTEKIVMSGNITAVGSCKVHEKYTNTYNLPITIKKEYISLDGDFSFSTKVKAKMFGGNSGAYLSSEPILNKKETKRILTFLPSSTGISAKEVCENTKRALQNKISTIENKGCHSDINSNSRIIPIEKTLIPLLNLGNENSALPE
jgi:hypothetical protein